MEQSQALKVYASTLEGLEKLALRDWLAWWDKTKGTSFIERRKLLEEPFAAIVAAYGEQAAYAAADYMFLQRGLDETLAGLAYPEVADPVGYEQAAASFRSMMRMSDKQWQSMVVEGEIDGIAEFNSVTFDRLSGALGRLVLEPARKTVANNIAPGARFARVPEPGACAFCLMLASRGAVYSKDTAGMTEATRYHDHCRCIAIEVSERAPLPAVNRELEKAWDEATSGGGSHGDMVRQWKNHLERRSAVLQSQVRFPAIPGVKVPGYRGKPVTVALSDEGKELELPLPDLHQMPGHVLYGWVTAPPWGRKRDDKRSRQPGDYSLDRRYGHKAGNKAGKTSFPAEWTDQQIVNAVRDVLESGDTMIDVAPARLQRDRQGNEWLPTYDYMVAKKSIINGVEIKAIYKVVDGVAVQPYGFPTRKEERK